MDTPETTAAIRPAAIRCHCGREVEPREPDPWEGRMDAYCDDCATARCDCYPDECPVKHPTAATCPKYGGKVCKPEAGALCECYPGKKPNAATVPA